ncbi:unnamed protein product [Bathycoccus prasinos]
MPAIALNPAVRTNPAGKTLRANTLIVTVQPIKTHLDRDN